MNDRPSVAPRVIFIGLGVSLVLSLLFGFFVYQKYIRYERVAESLLPASSQVTVTIGVEQGVVYQPFRAHFLPLFESRREGRETRLRHLERKTTLELGVDTRELAFAFTEDGGWALVLGGLFRQEGALAGTLAMLRDEGRPGVAELGPDLAQIGPRAYLSTARQGAIAVGSAPELVVAKPVRRVDGSGREAIRIRVWPKGGGAGETPALWGLDVELGSDFPFSLWNQTALPEVDVLQSELGRACSAPRPALLQALRASIPDPTRRRRVGHLGRDGFDQLLAELAAQLGERASLSFDP